jgi:hypothetical protein
MLEAVIFHLNPAVTGPPTEQKYDLWPRKNKLTYAPQLTI